MKRVITLASIIFFGLLFWELVASRFPSFRLLMSTPSLIAEFFLNNYVELLYAAGKTASEAFAGLCVAMVVAIGTLVVCVYLPKLMRIVLPFMIVLQVIPLITIAPLLIIIFGIGLLPIVIMSAVLAYFPIFVNLANGIRHVDRSIIDLFTLNNASVGDLIRYAYFPLSLPQLFAGLRIGSTLAVIGAIVAEFSGVPDGLGRNLYVSALRLESELMMCTLFLSSVLGFSFYAAVVFIERRIAFWYNPGLGI